MENMENMENKLDENISAGKKSGNYRKGVIVLTAVLTVFMTVCSCVSRNMGELPDEEEKEKFSRLSYYKNGRFENEEMVKFFPKEKRKKRNKLGMFRFLFKSPNAPETDLPKVLLSPKDWQFLHLYLRQVRHKAFYENEKKSSPKSQGSPLFQAFFS